MAMFNSFLYVYQRLIPSHEFGKPQRNPSAMGSFHFGLRITWCYEVQPWQIQGPKGQVLLWEILRVSMISRRNWGLFHSKLLAEGILQFSKIIGYYIIIYIFHLVKYYICRIYIYIYSIYIFIYSIYIYSIYIYMEYIYIFHIINLRQYPHDYRSNSHITRKFSQPQPSSSQVSFNSSVATFRKTRAKAP